MSEGNQIPQDREAAIPQERQAALTLLRGALADKDNFIELTWGPIEVNWPNPTKLRNVLSTHQEGTYRTCWSTSLLMKTPWK